LRAVETYGQIDVMVNNAGIVPIAPLALLKVDEWDRMIDLNIKGVLSGSLPLCHTCRSRRAATSSTLLQSSASRCLRPGGTVYWRSAELVRMLKKEGKWRFAAVDSNCKCSTGKALKCKVFGYTFGYRRQFALISANYAKLLIVLGLARSPITFNIPYLS
jgi:NAD(P)-dependent dehydrogenase (short-subunit alcohol dehydrogenase family)